MKILYGFFSGVGDFVSAIPIINNLKPRIATTIAITYNLVNLLDIFKVRCDSVIVFDKKKFSKKNIDFFYKINKSDFKYIIYSPHALYSHSSLYLPLLLKIFKKSSTQIIGAVHQKNSWAFDIKESVLFSQQSTYREYDLIKNLGLTEKIEKHNLKTEFNFLNERILSKKSNLISFHIGASRKNRIAPDEFWIDLINKIIKLNTYEIIIMGLENEISTLKKIYKKNNNFSNVKFISGDLHECVDVVARSRLVVTMDSGFGHIASSIGARHFCIFSSNAPLIAAPIYTNTTIIKHNEYCQPCLKKTCFRDKNYCLTNLDPDKVYSHIISTLHE